MLTAYFLRGTNAAIDENLDDGRMQFFKFLECLFFGNTALTVLAYVLTFSMNAIVFRLGKPFSNYF